MQNVNESVSHISSSKVGQVSRRPCPKRRPVRHTWRLDGRLLVSMILGFPALGLAQVDDTEFAVMRQAAQTVQPAVVRLELTGLDASSTSQSRAVTSGLVVGEDGWIVSSLFGFTNDPQIIFATFDNGERARAEIVARDTSRKLILLKTNPKQPLRVPEFIGLDDVEVGQSVVAVGRVLDTTQPNLSLGIVSAKHRVWGKALQSDAKISPNNYGGPLCDWRGRVIGMLVPISPQSEFDTAGNEWYDSGIGFAIPSEALLNALPRLAEGNDLHPGILGVLPDTNNLLAGPVTVASCLPRSPADRSGIRVGDRIVRVNETLIERYADLKHALGPLYAGDVCEVEAERDGQREVHRITLVDQVPPFAHGYLGLLPMRWPRQTEGVTIRYVFPDSPAARADIRAGDRLQSIDGRPITSVEDVHRALAPFTVDQQVKFSVRREAQTSEHTAILGSIPSATPQSLPSAYDQLEAIASLSMDSVQNLKLPDESVGGLVRVPSEFRTDLPHALLIWIDRPGAASAQRLEEVWGPTCDAFPLIVLSPESADPARWNPTDADFVGRLLEAAMKEYPVDPTLVVVGGFQTGGSLAMMVAMRQREVVRGIATLDALVVPSVLRASNEPLHRLSFLLAVSQSDRLSDATRAAQERLQRSNFPVEYHELSDSRDQVQVEDVNLIRDWLDRLDRF